MQNSTSTSNFADNTMNGAKMRIDWIDVLKGMSIFLVVMMHSTLGVQNAAGASGWMGDIVEFSRPFRIPAFMLVSGLFLHRTINDNWLRYFDRKILHFIYFYLLWVAIQTVVKTPAWLAEGQTMMEIMQAYLVTLVQPFSTLWFIYLLPVFYLVSRITRNLDWRFVLAIALWLELLPIHTASTLVNEFASRFVYFYIGYQFSANFFRWSEFAAKNWKYVLGFIAVWALVNASLVFNLPPESLQQFTHGTGSGPIAKMSDLPFIAFALAMGGVLAMSGAASMLLNIKWMGFLRWTGQHSIVIYLAFFLPMGVSRVILLKFAAGFLSVGSISLLVTLSAFIGPIIFYLIVKKIGFGMFLFQRPNWAKLNTFRLPRANKPAQSVH